MQKALTVLTWFVLLLAFAVGVVAFAGIVACQQGWNGTLVERGK